MSESNGDSDEEVEDLSSVRVWYEIDTDSIPPAPSHFPFTATPLVNVILDENVTPLAYFEIFFDDQLLMILVNETNNYANQEINKQSAQSSYKKSKKWVNVEIAEMKIFLGLLLLQCIVHLPEQEWYWTKRESIYVPIFGKVITGDRFRLIMKYWHFPDNSTFNPTSHPCPKLRKAYEVIEYLRMKFMTAIVPEQNITVDESLMLFKGRLGWKQFIPIKRSRFGIKFILFV